ncbi:hypothetical protein UR09_01295 [Candidatus Nitromaritima sp. SCGC AAA799-A02]|nr:hypothetical protein UZ36_04020 [Candidatus Nitromaritima sp. SCGC AAA799-C22]KMP12393.1 hypothetical protein UR09_01295 [Candidatus Nitromaritima sp. SCGC AAA799-A02]
MSLLDIVKANEAYDRSVEKNVERAKEDKTYQEELQKAWNQKLQNIESHKTLTGLEIPLISVPHIDHPSHIARYCGEWGFPGEFPFGLSIYPKAFLIVDGAREHEEPTRIFAGLGSPKMTNGRFHHIMKQQQSKRLSTAFDTNTLLGRGANNPDYFHDIGEGGVSVTTYQDILTLYDGFFDDDVSISMTINGPSLWMTAARLQAAGENGGNLENVRGTSQTDPCKEDDAQNELLFPLGQSIKIAMDMFEWCSRNAPHYYPINVSGYHIEQKGATPIQQAAFTLANGFVYIEEALQRGMNINTIGKRLPFFFTSGPNIEYIALLSAVRRIWAVSLRDVYGADNPDSQKLKAHVQTSGRSLYEREILNNITRTTAELFYALLNYPQALHSNSYDEPITTPTEGAVRIASDAQSILIEEMGGFKEMMGFLGDGSGREKVYHLVMKGILDYFRQIDEFGGTLQAKADGFFRDEIANSSREYNEQIHSGIRRIIAVNRYTEGRQAVSRQPRIEISEEVKRKRIEEVRQFKNRRDQKKVREDIRKLQEVADNGGNVFEVTMEIVRNVTLDEWTQALHKVFGMYRRKI